MPLPAKRQTQHAYFPQGALFPSPTQGISNVRPRFKQAWKPPVFYFHPSSFGGVLERTLHEELGMIRKGGVARWAASKVLSQVPFMPDRLAQRLSGLETPIGEEGQRYAKAAAVLWARMKRYDKENGLQGYADSAMHYALPNAAHKQLTLQQAKLIRDRMLQKKRELAVKLRMAGLKSKANPSIAESIRRIQRNKQKYAEYLKRQQATPRQVVDSVH